MGAFCALVLGGILGYSAASMVAEDTIRKLKEIVARGEKIRKERENGGTTPPVSTQ